jgi:Flp pilus assembly CpaE family ATPase
VIALADEVLVIVEPARVTLAMAESLLRSLDLLGVDPARISLVTVSRSVPGLSAPAASVRALLAGREPSASITAAPELAFQSAENSTPMVMLQPDGPLAEEYRGMAQQLTAKERHRGTCNHAQILRRPVHQPLRLCAKSAAKSRRL